MNGSEDFELFVAGRSTVLLRTAYLLCAGDRGAAEDLMQVVDRVKSVTGRPDVY